MTLIFCFPYKDGWVLFADRQGRNPEGKLRTFRKVDVYRGCVIGFAGNNSSAISRTRLNLEKNKDKINSENIKEYLEKMLEEELHMEGLSNWDKEFKGQDLQFILLTKESGLIRVYRGTNCIATPIQPNNTDGWVINSIGNGGLTWKVTWLIDKLKSNNLSEEEAIECGVAVMQDLAKDYGGVIGGVERDIDVVVFKNSSDPQSTPKLRSISEYHDIEVRLSKHKKQFTGEEIVSSNGVEDE
jgi:hypothetical protein